MTGTAHRVDPNQGAIPTRPVWLVRPDSGRDAMTAAESAEKSLKTELTPYEQIGGEATVRRLADRFYGIMESDPGAARIRAMHGQDLAPIRKLLFEFLSGWLGGPALYFQRP